MAFAAQALFQHMSPHHHLASATKKLYSKVVNYVMDGGGPVWAQSAHSCDLAKIAKDCLLTGQEQACTRITWLFGCSFVRLSPRRKWPNTQENGG